MDEAKLDLDGMIDEAVKVEPKGVLDEARRDALKRVVDRLMERKVKLPLVKVKKIAEDMLGEGEWCKRRTFYDVFARLHPEYRKFIGRA